MNIMYIFLGMSSKGFIKHSREVVYLQIFANFCSRPFLLDIHAATPNDKVSKAINMLYALCPSLCPVIFAINSIIYYFKNGFSQKGLGNKDHVCASVYGLKILSNIIYHLILKIYENILFPFYRKKNDDSNPQSSELTEHEFRSAIQSKIVFPHQIFVKIFLLIRFCVLYLNT